jgi:hypothetical protein
MSKYSDPNSPVFAVTSLPLTPDISKYSQSVLRVAVTHTCSVQSTSDLINTARCAVKHCARQLRSNYRGRYQHYIDQVQRGPMGTASDITSDVNEHVMWPVVIC